MKPASQALLFTLLLLVAVVGLLWLVFRQDTVKTPSFVVVTPTPSPEILISPPVITTAPELHPLILLEFPTPEAYITSPLVITGQARGTWFFEATFPVILTNWDGLIIAEGYATAQDEWMTEEFIPFTATLEFIKPEYGERGSLILQKANPSGLPEFDDAVEITIFFE